MSGSVIELVVLNEATGERQVLLLDPARAEAAVRAFPGLDADMLRGATLVVRPRDTRSGRVVTSDQMVLRGGA